MMLRAVLAGAVFVGLVATGYDPLHSASLALLTALTFVKV